MSLSPGQPAPSFSLYNEQKQLVNLEDQRGKTILILFFPFAFSSVCTKELCNVRDNITMYNDQDVEVFGISVDSLYCLAKFKSDQGLNFSLLSDFNKETSEAYDSLYANFGYGMKGVSKRSAFIIDKGGIIRYAEILENAGEIPDFEAINKTLAALDQK